MAEYSGPPRTNLQGEKEQRRPCETDNFNRFAAGLSTGNVVEIEVWYATRRIPVSAQSPDEK